MLRSLWRPRLALLVLVLALAGCAGLKYEPMANSSGGYDGLDGSDDGMYD